MNSISFPSYVAALARRIFNVVSTLSISSQYYALQEDKGQFRPNIHNLRQATARELALEGWVRGMKRDRNTAFQHPLNSSILNASSLPIPLLNKNWWSSVFSFEHQGDASLPPPRMDPPPSFNQTSPRPSKKLSSETPEHKPPLDSLDIIHQLMMNPALADPLRTPRYPIILCHGLYGFGARGPTNFPSLRMHYWANALQILRGTIGAEVIVTSVPGTGNIISRSARLDEQIQEKARGRGVNFLAHSMGGLDCRHLITHRQPTEYTPLSLTSISTPHRGSPFMDWCMDNIGIGKLRQHERQLLYGRANQNEEEEAHAKAESTPPSTDAETENHASSSSRFNLTSLPSSFTTLLLSTVDSPAYANLTTAYLNEVFNPATPDDPKVKYFSVAGRAGSVSVLHPFWFTKMVVDGVEEEKRARLATEGLASGGKWLNLQSESLPVWADEREWGNDGLVTVQSAKWGEFLGILDNCDHWEMRGARGLEFGVDFPAIPAIGLGSAPLSTSTSGARMTPPTASSSSQTKEAWYTREWMRFAGGWKRDDKDGKSSASSSSQFSREESPLGASSSSNGSPPSEQQRKEEKRQRQREFTKGDQVVRSSTDRLSLVFDWLVDQIPLSGVGTLPTSFFKDKGKGTETDVRDSNQIAKSSEETRKFAADMLAYTAGGSSSSNGDKEYGPLHSLYLSPDAKPETLKTEVKKMMERERKRWRKNELARKEDLERFYVALSRKMWDEGL